MSPAFGVHVGPLPIALPEVRLRAGVVAYCPLEASEGGYSLPLPSSMAGVTSSGAATAG